MINNYIIGTLFVMNFQVKFLKQKDPMVRRGLDFFLDRRCSRAEWSEKTMTFCANKIGTKFVKRENYDKQFFFSGGVIDLI